MMNRRLAFPLVALLGACAQTGRPSGGLDAGSDGPMTIPTDGSVDMARKDFSFPGGDMAGDDMNSGGGCTTIATWAGLEPFANYDDAGPTTFGGSQSSTTEPFDALGFEDWHITSGYPKNVTFSSTDSYFTCDVCVALYEQVQGGQAAAFFFAQSGSMTVTTADENIESGTLNLTGTNLHLVEWDLSTDTAVPGGRCYDIGTATLNKSWLNPQDAGAADMTVVADMSSTDMAGQTPDMATGPCKVVVNEIRYAGSLSGTSADEFVELYNQCGTTVNIGGYKIAYRSAKNNGGGADVLLHTVPANTMLAANAYYLLAGTGYTGGPTANATFPNGAGLSSVGGGVGLYNASSVLIDSIAYDDLEVDNNFTETVTADNPGGGMSAARSPNGVDTDINWGNAGPGDFDTQVSTPKAANN